MRNNILSIRWIVICLVLILILCVVFLIRFANERATYYDNITKCGGNIRELCPSLFCYLDRNSGTWPICTTWCDDLNGLVDQRFFKCPGGNEGPCSYAINRNIIGINNNDLPANMVVLFESKPGWNQVGGPELLNVDNHAGTGCYVILANHDRYFAHTEDLENLCWKVDENKSEIK